MSPSVTHSSPPSSLKSPKKSSPKGVKTVSFTGVAPPDWTEDYVVDKQPAVASWAYLAIWSLFRLVLKVFYSDVVVEGSENITSNGTPTILCANHSNSLTDALLLVTTVPRSKRSLLRLTAKATQFGRSTFTSWLIESAGTLPIQRPKDAEGKPVDNTVVFKQLIESLEHGDMVCMFPEGLSRYYPFLAPLKQGVARIVSDTLSRQRHNADFSLSIQTCSITYLHRNLFRSSVLVTYHKPIVVSAASHPGLVGSPTTTADYAAVRALTAQVGEQIRHGTLDAPDWKYIRLANTARRLYAPLGTSLGLGDTVRLTQRFVDAFATKKRAQGWNEEGSDLRGALSTPMMEKTNGIEDAVQRQKEEDEVDQLAKNLQTYQDLLTLHGLKDDRLRNSRLLRRRTLYKRLFIRLAGAAGLFLISIPGLFLWLPVFFVTRTQTSKLKKSGPVFDTYDEVAQTKLVYGFLTSMAVLVVANLVCLPILPLTIPLFPTLMWLSLRWLEDTTSSLRAALALFRMLHLGKRQLILLREMREGLRVRVLEVAVRECALPRTLDELERESRGWKVGRVVGFFSLNSRRKKDWNETLKLFDVSDYPADDNIPPEELARSSAGLGGGGEGAIDPRLKLE